MARILIVGCSERGLALAQDLLEEGHAVRITTRDQTKLDQIRGVGAEGVVADPDRIASLMPALAGVSVLCWLLGNATADPQRLDELFGTRLEMMLERTVDSGVRAFLYEGLGSVPADLLASGAAKVERLAGLNRIPYAILKSDQSDPKNWVEQAKNQIMQLLSAAL